ncbi:ubiquinone/menaquinone biosynthesis C-methylase UbiE [Haloferula luteola]|uniref:Ubiquinone/menaquinone biosynthesis C-methylase UbiE n=1 Tax=Haloferula luteola TaxID=595692 RepID=A0A840V6D3_9BACT|nr:class I SAM-dependent methyltransferase [Haloferula luteola]MBB5352586.1 ubiquinone/menaquinone biosynthesis C-methylase UbiE [Haloferula luteola]
MHPDVLNGITADFETARKLKAVFREGWSHPERVAGWVKGGLHAEFHDEACRQAWKDALSEAVQLAPSDRALDLGTGPGTIASMWAELGFRTTGIDFSPGMLEAGHKLATSRGLNLEFIEGDAEDPPVGDQSFGVISTRFVLYTLPHPGYAVRRWVQLLEPGGKLLLIGHERPDNSPPPTPTTTALQAPPKRGWQVDDHYRSALDQLPFMDHKPTDLQVVMEAAGLSEIRRLPIAGLESAREQLRQRDAEVAVGTSHPYIVVGRK